MVYISEVLEKYAKENHLDDEVEINIEISIYRDDNGEGIFISHDGASGVQYHIKTSSDLGSAVESYIDLYV